VDFEKNRIRNQWECENLNGSTPYEGIVFIRIGENDYNQRIRELDCHYRKRMKNGDWRLSTGERLVYMWDYEKDCAVIRVKVHCSAMKEFSEFLYYYLSGIDEKMLLNYLIVYSDIKNKLVNKYKFNRY
jgi:hypothetical protein